MDAKMRARRDTGLVKAAIKSFWEDGGPITSGGLAYFTIFALPPLLVLVVMITSQFVSGQEAIDTIQRTVSDMIGDRGAEMVRKMLEATQEKSQGSGWMAVLGIAGLTIAATSAFAELQKALNRAWQVRPDPDKGGLKKFLGKRILSLFMIVIVALLLMGAVLLSTVMPQMAGQFSQWTQINLPDAILVVGVDIVLFLLMVLLFAAIFTVLPDAKVALKDVWIGSLVTAVLFLLGKYAVSFYISKSDPGAAFGAAGTFAVLLIWIFFGAAFLLLGAEFTQAWATRHGSGVRPSKNAVKVEPNVRFDRTHQEIIELKKQQKQREKDEKNKPPVDF